MRVHLKQKNMIAKKRIHGGSLISGKKLMAGAMDSEKIHNLANKINSMAVTPRKEYKLTGKKFML